MEYLYDYGLFLAQAITIVVAIIFIIGSAASIGQKQSFDEHGHIEITKLNDHYQNQSESIKAVIHSEDERKNEKKEKKIKSKLDKKNKKNLDSYRRRIYVLDFDGDIKASATENLRSSISAILTVATKKDEVLLRLESGGGMVHSYGLAASQLQRIKEKGITLTIAVDKVSASGGYMMACVANHIIAAPFAVIGSIGVLAQIPNFHRLLKDNKIDFELLTAGEHKRTLTMFGENTDEQRGKFTEELEDTHKLFKSFVAEHRPDVEIASVATGEVWYGQRALSKKLVDELRTSDSYIMEATHEADVFHLNFAHKKSWQEKLGIAAENGIERSFLKLWQQATNKFKV